MFLKDYPDRDLSKKVLIINGTEPRKIPLEDENGPFARTNVILQSRSSKCLES